MLTALSLLLLTLAAGEEGFTQPLKDEKSPAEFGHRLSKEEALAGWIALFDGETTFGFREAKLETIDKAAVLSGGTTTSPFHNYTLKINVIRAGTLRAGEKFVAELKPGLQLLKCDHPRAELRLEDGLAISQLSLRPGKAQPLLNGKDLAGWRGLIDIKSRMKSSPTELAKAQKAADEKMSAHWKAEDGILVFDGKGDSLCSAKDYANFELYVDWKIEKAGDSGIYVRGTPQIQIWDTAHEPYFKLGAEKGSGALWNNKKHARFPDIKADKPAGQWNTFYVRMVGEKVLVKLNGQLVVNDVVLENYWEEGQPVYPTGSIELQNHGNTLYFRNIYLKELP